MPLTTGENYAGLVSAAVPVGGRHFMGLAAAIPNARES